MDSVEVKQHGYLLAQSAVSNWFLWTLGRMVTYSNHLMDSVDVKQHGYLLAQASSEPGRDQEQGDGAGLS